MALRGAADPIMCRVFPITLAGSARIWFTKLKPNSIGSFAYLQRQFHAQFLWARRKKRLPTYLLTIKQDDSESLQEFMTRFNREKLTVDDPDENLVLAALILGITPRSSFMKELARKPPHTLQQFMDRAAEHINAADIIRAFSEQHVKRPVSSDQRKRKESHREPHRENHDRPARDSRRFKPFRSEKAPVDRDLDFTPLNTLAAKILLHVQDDRDIVWPGKLESPPETRRRDKFCEFHRDHGHDTNDCYALKKQLERMVRKGKLDRFLDPISSPFFFFFFLK
jgi:hypothetical protein